MRQQVMWRALKWPGIEHLQLREQAQGIAADGVVVARFDGAPLRLRYRIECDRGWNTRGVALELVAGGQRLELSSDALGHWRAAPGEPLPELEGCMDVDIALTLFTNTLPIRRLGLRPGEARDLRVAYLAPPQFRPQAVVQRYSCLEQRAGDAVYRYESKGFRADLRVDEDGLVCEYPDFWEQLS